jgi:outer membrane protein assembly factor BamA
MFLPILDAEDGYGVTFGARLALAGAGNSRSRFSFPLTWGGLKQAGAEFEQTFTGGPITRVQFGGGIQRQTNPGFQFDDDRRRVWARAERRLGPVRAGATVGWQGVTFNAVDDHFTSAGADVTLDTRIDPWLPRNAVFASASWEHLNVHSAGGINRTGLDAQGYVGLLGQSILVLRATRDDASQPLPPYLQSLLGGWSSLRGFKAGSFIGDTVVTGSAELRIPLTSPLNVGKLGVSVFIDEGKAYAKGDSYSSEPFQRGIGGSVWLSAAVFRLSLSVAHGRGATTRVNFGAGLMF